MAGLTHWVFPMTMVQRVPYEAELSLCLRTIAGPRWNVALHCPKEIESSKEGEIS